MDTTLPHHDRLEAPDRRQRRRLWCVAAASLLLLGSLTTTPSPAWAQQQPGATASSNESVRYDRKLKSIKVPGGARVRLRQAAGGRGWTLEVTEGSGGRELAKMSLPGWVGEPFYDYRATVVSVGRGKRVVLFEALPSNQREAPPGASLFQVAWLVERDRRGREREWKLVGTATPNPIDGGEELLLTREEGERYVTLRRRRSELSASFCGATVQEDFHREVFAPDEQRFKVQIDLSKLSAKARPLKAELPTAFEAEPLTAFFRWQSASSDFLDRDRTGDILRPVTLSDERSTTAWVEAGQQRWRGEFVTARVDEGLKLKAVRIFPGHGKDAQSFARFAQPTRVLLGAQGQQRYLVELPPVDLDTLQKTGGYVVTLPEPITTDCLSVLILDAEPTSGERNRLDARRYAAFSEITPLSELHGLPEAQAAERILDLLLDTTDLSRRNHLDYLIRPYGKALIGPLRRKLQEVAPEDQERLIPVLSVLPAEEAVPLLVEMIERLEVGQPGYLDVKKALHAHHQEAAAPLAKMLIEDPPSDPRKHASMVRLFGRIASPDQLQALVPRLGTGGTQLRNERIRALVSGGPQLVEPLIHLASRRDVDDAVRHDAIKALDMLGRRLWIDKQADDVEASGLIKLLETTTARRTRLRLIRALGWYRPEGGVRRLGIDVLRSSKDPLQRAEAVQALAHFEGDLARQLVESALKDDSPDVRIAAIRALMDRSDREKSRDAVRAYVVRERWPLGLRPAFRFLAQSGEPELVAVVEEAVTEAPDSRRALLAAQALERERLALPAAVTDQLLKAPLDDVPYRMRRQLIELLAYENSTMGHNLLWRVVEGDPLLISTLEPDRQLKLQKQAALALGRRREPESRDQLLQLARKAPEVSLQLAALRALGFYRDEQILKELKFWQRDVSPRLRDALEQTITLLERRLQIESVGESIDDFGQRLGQDDDD